MSTHNSYQRTYNTRTQTDRGAVVYYICSMHQDCKVYCQVVYSPSNEYVEVLTAGEHSTLPKQAKNRLPPECIAAMEEACMFIDQTPKVLRQMLRKKGLKVLSVSQIMNWKSRKKSKEQEGLPTTFSELSEMCSGNSVPDNQDPHKAFIAYHHVDPSGDIAVIFVTTVSLLSQVRLRDDIVHLDATYKMTWERYPCVIPCLTDYNSSGHPLGFAIMKKEDEEHFTILLRGMAESVYIHVNKFVWRPKVLIKDCSPAIGNSFRHLFGEEVTVVDCWAHVARNIYDKLTVCKCLDLLQDIRLLQRQGNVNVFKIGLQLFLDYYNMHGNAQVKEFLLYFKKEYVSMFRGWNEAHAPGYPSTNNSQEVQHRM